MTGSYLLHNELHYKSLKTDLGLTQSAHIIIGTYPMQPTMNLSISAHKFAKNPEQKSTNSLKYARKCFASSAEMRKFAP